MHKASIAVAFAALALPAAATAQVSHHQARRYQRVYHAVATRYGSRAPGRNILNDGLATGKPVTTSAVKHSIEVLGRMLIPVPAPRVLRRTVYHQPAVTSTPMLKTTLKTTSHSAPTSTTSRPVAPAPRPVAPAASTPVSSGGLSSVPGVPSGFAACVAMRESSNGAGSSNVYGIIPASGYNVAGESVAQQKQTFSRIYHTVGASAWSKYDGC